MTGSFWLGIRAYLIDFEGPIPVIRRSLDLGVRTVTLEASGGIWQELAETGCKPVPAWANFVGFEINLFPVNGPGSLYFDSFEQTLK